MLEKPIEDTVVEITRELSQLRDKSGTVHETRRDELLTRLRLIGATAHYFGGFEAMQRLHDAAAERAEYGSETATIINDGWNLVGNWMA